jgi:hypothetical protein
MAERPDSRPPDGSRTADASETGHSHSHPSRASEEGPGYDVLLAVGRTDDGAGAQVLRARPGRIEAGEVRTMTEGRPLTEGGEVVRLERRKDVPALYDVHVECKVPERADASTRTRGGPAQVATEAYRESWARTFGRASRNPTN